MRKNKQRGKVVDVKRTILQSPNEKIKTRAMYARVITGVNTKTYCVMIWNHYLDGKSGLSEHINCSTKKEMLNVFNLLSKIN